MGVCQTERDCHVNRQKIAIFPELKNRMQFQRWSRWPLPPQLQVRSWNRWNLWGRLRRFLQIPPLPSVPCVSLDFVHYFQVKQRWIKIPKSLCHQLSHLHPFFDKEKQPHGQKFPLKQCPLVLLTFTLVSYAHSWRRAPTEAWVEEWNWLTSSWR